MLRRPLLAIAILVTVTCPTYGQEEDFTNLELMDSSDLNVLKESDDLSTPTDLKSLDLSELEEKDDLEALKEDIGDLGRKKNKISKKGEEIIDVGKIVNKETGDDIVGSQTVIFDVGEEERKLLDLSKFVESKIPDKEWNEIASTAQTDKYIVQENEWLWKISKTLFGSGFYYSKIWSLNPHITNPHEIEPGMVLVFDTGDIDTLPSVKVGEFAKGSVTGKDVADGSIQQIFDFTEFGDEVVPPWIKDRKKLIDQGVYFQYASEETYEDLVEIGRKSLNKEYEKYEPPFSEIIIKEPGGQYDDAGFDKDSKITFNFKEGFFLNTFLTTNIVQDFGEIAASPNENVFIQQFDRIYIDFDSSVKVKPGDMFSVYTADGKVSHPVSDRTGYRYTVVSQIKTIKKINDLWECSVEELTGILERGDRVTVYTPKINRIVKTFNRRSIEAAIMGSFNDTANGLSFGDVVYVDRGRADGVELGNVFEIYDFIDRGTGERITIDPTYKIGELTVISLTDNFATALISNSSQPIGLGNIALSKTLEQAARASRVGNRDSLRGVEEIEAQALDELDVELNLDDISEDLLDQADKIQLTEDELEELERQEREKSIIRDHERDLKELDRLESELVEAENQINEARVDEDKFLEQQDLESLETGFTKPDINAFESLDEIERDVGRKYMDEDLNSKENPYGLTEFDLEEIDELLNTD